MDYTEVSNDVEKNILYFKISSNKNCRYQPYASYASNIQLSAGKTTPQIYELFL